MSSYLGFQPTNSSEYFFVSYNNNDAHRIGPIAEAVSEMGVDLWYDHGIEYGENWETYITEKIQNAQAVILFFTKGILSKKNSYVQREYKIATQFFHKKVYMILLDDIDNADIPVDKVSWWMEIREMQFINGFAYPDSYSLAQGVVAMLGYQVQKAFPTTHTVPIQSVPPTRTYLEQENAAPAQTPPPVPPQNSSPPTRKKGKKGKVAFVALLLAICLILTGVYWAAYTENQVAENLFIQLFGEEAFHAVNRFANRLASALLAPPDPSEQETEPPQTQPDSIEETTEPSETTNQPIETTEPDTTQPDTTESDTTDLMYFQGLEYSSNGDGTCSLVGIGTCTDTDIVIPEVLPNGDIVVSIGYEAFRYCDHITSVSIPSSVTCIDDFAFFECKQLTSIVIPNGVTNIGFAAFAYCENLQSIALSESVTSIELIAFSVCPSLNSIIVAKENPVYESINNCLIEKSSHTLIRGCNTSIIPDGVEFIGEYAFDNLSDLQSIAIPASVQSIGENAFNNCQSLTSVFMENGVQEIGKFAFQNCSNLKSLVLPESLTTIAEPGAFAAGALTNIEVAEGNPVYYSVNNCLIERQSKKLILGCQNSIIPDDITGIGNYAFMECENLTSVVIPDGVTSIGICAFAYTESLTSVVIPEGVTTLGESAFFGCKNIKSIVLPDSVTSIGQAAFGNCSELTSIVLPQGITALPAVMFSNCWNLKTLVIPNSVTIIGQCFYLGSLDSVYFVGSEEEWNAIDIHPDNEHLLSATIHYNYVPES